MKNKNKSNILIIGGGFAGLTALHNLQHSLHKQVAITVIDKNSDSVNRPTMPEVAFDGKPAAHSRFPLNLAVNSHDSKLLRGTVISIDASSNCVRLKDGRILEYDYLILAPGPVHDFNAVSGLDEFGYSPCDETHATHLWDALQNFKGGDVVIGSAPSQHGTRVETPVLKAACEGPVGEAMFMMEHFLRKHQWRDQSSIKVFSPADAFFEDVGPQVHQDVGPLIEKAGIEVVTEKEIKQVTADHVEFSDGSQWHSDFTIILPPHTAPAFIANSGLGDEAGWVPTDNTMRHLDYSNIFAAGDCTALSQPKLGHIATIQGEIAAKAIAKELGANVEVPEFKPEVMCIMNRGGHEATLIYSDTFYGGSHDTTISGSLPYLMKWTFDKEIGYTHGHLPPEWLEHALKWVLEHK